VSPAAVFAATWAGESPRSDAGCDPSDAGRSGCGAGFATGVAWTIGSQGERGAGAERTNDRRSLL